MIRSCFSSQQDSGTASDAGFGKAECVRTDTRLAAAVIDTGTFLMGNNTITLAVSRTRKRFIAFDPIIAFIEMLPREIN